MYDSIVVPLDGSQFSEQALPIAFAIARKTSATIHLVTVHQPLPVGGEFDHGLDAGVREWQKSYVEEVARRLESEGAPAVRPVLLHGLAARELRAYAAEHAADLFVMTTHGRSGVSRAWLGSVADRLVREVNVPVLLLRPREGEPPSLDSGRLYQRVLIPLDGSPLSESILEPATRLGDLGQAEYDLLRVVPPALTIGSPYLPHTVREDEAKQRERNAEAERYLGDVSRRLASAGTRTLRTTVLVEPGTAEPILAFADSQGSDLIAMATHGRGGLTRAILGSVADKVVRGAKRAVLVYRPEREPS